MKFKPITPGMVIHCPKEEDADILLKHLESIGYVWDDEFKCKRGNQYAGWNYYGSDTCFGTGQGSKIIVWSRLQTWQKAGLEITEFSDLIEPEPNTSSNALNDNSNAQMSAVEVLEWLIEKDDTALFEKVFDERRYINQVFTHYTAQEIFDKITAYEAAKAPKPVEVEWGYRCYIDKSNIGRTVNEYILWGVNEQAAKDDVIDKALKYTKETGEQVIAGVTFICRVKEGKS